MNKENVKKSKFNKETSMWKVCTERIAAIFAAILLWQLLAMKLDQKLLLATPVDVARVLGTLLKSSGFYSTIVYSMSKILLGLLIGTGVGIGCALLSGRCRLIELLLWPYFSAMKATPVASIVILCLVWLSGRRLSVFIVFLVVTPVIYTNILAGIKNLDPKMSDMARVFGLNGVQRLLYVYLPELKTYIVAAFTLSTGMAFKAGIAAEVIGTPQGSVGKMLYNAKVYLETPELFAWTVVIVILSVIVEKVIMTLIRCMFDGLQMKAIGKQLVRGADKGMFDGLQMKAIGKQPVREADKDCRNGASIDLDNVCFSYENQKERKPVRKNDKESRPVNKNNKEYRSGNKKAGGSAELINKLSMHIAAGDRVCIMAPSGTGKTTLLNLITGRLVPDSGSISFEAKRCNDNDCLKKKATYKESGHEHVDISMVFQEDRLCNGYSAAYNIELGLKRHRQSGLEDIRKNLEQVGMEESLFTDVKELSGGMKRRVAIVRAVMSPGQVLILDEPFASLDEELKNQTAAYINANLNGRTLIVVTHDGKDADRLNARIQTLQTN